MRKCQVLAMGTLYMSLSLNCTASLHTAWNQDSEPATHTLWTLNIRPYCHQAACVYWDFFWHWPSRVPLAYPVLLKPFDLFLPVMFLSRSMVMPFHSCLGTVLWTNLTLSYQVHFIASWCFVFQYLFSIVSIGEQEKSECFPSLAASCSPGLSCTRGSALIEWRWLSFLKITFKFGRISMHVEKASCNYLS